jgi:hypothetical protein
VRLAPEQLGHVRRGKRQVDMVGCRHLGVESTALALQRVTQPAEVGMAILLIEEAGPAIMAVLHDVQRFPADPHERTSRRGQALGEIEPGPFCPPAHVRGRLAVSRINLVNPKIVVT